MHTVALYLYVEMIDPRWQRHLFLLGLAFSPNGKASGFHVLGIPGSKGKIVAGSERLLDATHAIWEANVVIDGVLKGAKSTFFPIWMTPKQVLIAIAEAYENRVCIADNLFKGLRNLVLKYA